VAEAVGKRFFAPDHKPLAEGDPAAMTVRHAAGQPEPVGRQFPSAEELLANFASPAEPAPEVAAEVAPEAAPEPSLAGLRVVGRMPGGGAIWERARPDDDDPPAAAA
jgi:hypothetical protein